MILARRYSDFDANGGVYPLEVECSALLEAGYTNYSPPTNPLPAIADATIAVCFKPTVVDTTKPLCDPTNHYLLLIRKIGGNVEFLANGNSVGSYASTATTMAALLSEALTQYCGADKGYYSNMHVVDGAALEWSVFYELSGKAPGLWVCKAKLNVTYGPKGGYYPFTNGAVVEGTNIFTGGTPSASSEYSGFPATDAFDGSYVSDDSWCSATGQWPALLQYQLPAPKTMRFYKVAPYDAAGYGADDWTIEGSNDGTNWDTLDTVEGFDWTPAHIHYFEVDNPGSYLYYRMNITAAYTQNRADVIEWEGYEQAAPFGLGTDFSGNQNHWIMSGVATSSVPAHDATQTDDTPTHNGGVAVWEALPEPEISDTSKFADVLLRDGTGAPATVGNLKFQPDLVNIKDRTAARSWVLTDSIRGVQKQLATDSAAVESSLADALTGITADGYGLGVNALVNNSGESYLDLALKADPAAGFDIATFTGNGATIEVPHNLGKAPTFIMLKSLNDAVNWGVYHVALGPLKGMPFTNSAAIAGAAYWNNTAPTSTHFTVGSGLLNKAGVDYVAYLFTDSDVFKAFSYTGNANADGPVVDLGGTPLAIPFWKSTAGSHHWLNVDTLREPTNPLNELLYPSSAVAEAPIAGVQMHATSNGFKVTGTHASENGNGYLVVGLAILKQPFKYSNAY